MSTLTVILSLDSPDKKLPRNFGLPVLMSCFPEATITAGEGHFKGEKETSYRLIFAYEDAKCDLDQPLTRLWHVLHQFKQESALIITENQRVGSHPTKAYESAPVDLGYWVHCTQAEAEENGDYSFFDGQYFIAQHIKEAAK